MIKRISRNNDYMDHIISCPADVVDSIYKIEYFIFGYEDESFVADFVREGDVISAIIPAEELVNFHDGVLYRKAHYSTPDERYPDGVYNLEMVDDLDVWIY